MDWRGLEVLREAMGEEGAPRVGVYHHDININTGESWIKVHVRAKKPEAPTDAERIAALESELDALKAANILRIATLQSIGIDAAFEARMCADMDHALAANEKRDACDRSIYLARDLRRCPYAASESFKAIAARIADVTATAIAERKV